MHSAEELCTAGHIGQLTAVFIPAGHLAPLSRTNLNTVFSLNLEIQRSQYINVRKLYEEIRYSAGCAQNSYDIFETLTWIMLLLSEKLFYTQMIDIDFGFLRAYLARIQDLKLILKFNVKFATCTHCTAVHIFS